MVNLRFLARLSFWP